MKDPDVPVKRLVFCWDVPCEQLFSVDWLTDGREQVLLTPAALQRMQVLYLI
jgi:hypothetical protein